MTFDRPLLLLALLSLPVLWLLSRMIHERRVVRVTSLLLWRKLGLTPEPPRETRRKSDRLLLLRLAAAAVISIGLAGPRFSLREAPPVLHVVRDATRSMQAFSAAADAAIEQIRDAAPDGATVQIREIDDGDELLPILTGIGGTGDVVFVTDHPPEGLGDAEGLRIVLVGSPVENVGITAAWIEEGMPRVVVENFAAAAREVSIGVGSRLTTVTLEPGGAFFFEGGERGDEVVILPGDAFAFDDRVQFQVARLIREPALGWTGPVDRDLVRALRSCGVGVDSARPGGLSYRVDPPEDVRVVVAPPGERRPVRGTVVSGEKISPDAIPAPSTPLGFAVKMEHTGEVLLSDADGPLASFDGNRVLVALDPGDPASAWSRDPAFPIFWAEVVRLVFGEPPALAGIVGDPLDRSESATQAVSAPADLTALRACPPETEDPGTSGSPWLYLIAAGLLVAHLVLERRRDSPLVESTA